MGHRAARIDFQRFLETADSLFMMIAKTPVDATVEPALRRRDAVVTGREYEPTS
jgi:hypothetical protein